MTSNTLINIFLFIAFAFDVILAYILLFRAPLKESTRIFGYSTLSVGLWTLGIFMFGISENTTLSLFWNREFIFTSGFIASTFLHFSLVLTGYKLNNFKKIALHLPNLLILVGVFIPDAFIREIIVRSWGKESILGYLYPLFAIYFSSYVLIGLYRIFISTTESKGIQKTQLSYIFLATLLTSIVGTYFNLYLILAGNYRYIWIGPYNSLVLVSIIAYAITKTRLMDISVIISKSIAYGLTMIILGLFYFAFAIPYRYFVSPNIDIGFLSMTVAYGVFVGFAFERLRMFIQTSSDKLFLKGKYDFTDTIAYFSEKLSYVAGMEDLKAVLEEARVEKMELKMLDVRQKGDLSGKEAEYYSKNKKPAVFDELPEELKDEEKKKDIEYIVPCLFKGELISLLYVGKKLSEDAFRDEELDALKVIAPQIAVVIERIKPYERVKVDLATEQEKVKIAQKAAEDNARLAALGTLAAGLAHEIRNPMTVLRSKSETVLERIDDKEYVSNYARMMPEQIDRILSIINRMLKFAKAKSEEMETTDINKVIEDTLSMLEGRIKDKSIKVEKELDAKNKIMANPVMLSEAFFNIMQNSLDFTGKDGVLKARSFDSENNVEIEIADTGSGMTKEQVDHIFEPFYTTRAEGTGLGLSIAHRNIIDHKGKIEVSSQIGKGTAFKMTFPSI